RRRRCWGRRAAAPRRGAPELSAGIAHAAAGDRPAALARLRAAAEIFAAAGMRDLQAQTVREQRRLGVRVPAPRSGTGPGKGAKSGRGAGSGKSAGDAPFGLSPRELQIAGLVAEGCSNQQIAERLYLSVRTVETHLTRVFAKIGVTSRVGVATAMQRQT
ncbi:response regulator transcription factor, partial [Actinomadura sp. CNU-125]|uniref:response regulator transcription factor n=1 Tax=Actinomadura sp. CNU-125 TaxID=1904961 RepID=UPI000B29AD5C